MERKIAKRVERVFKGIAHQKRARILEFIAKQNGATVWQISQSLKIEFKNASQHTARIERAGLIEKRYVGRAVAHFLTPYGQKVYNFIQTLR